MHARTAPARTEKPATACLTRYSLHRPAGTTAGLSIVSSLSRLEALAMLRTARAAGRARTTYRSTSRDRAEAVRFVGLTLAGYELCVLTLTRSA